MTIPTRVLVACLACACLAGCVGLEHHDYWEGDDSLAVNLITLPFELLLTPSVFVLKSPPVL